MATRIGAFTESSSAPLADYFFIAGIESARIWNKAIPTGTTANPDVGPSGLDSAVKEDGGLPTTLGNGTNASNSPSGPNGLQRQSTHSYEPGRSTDSFVGLDSKAHIITKTGGTIRAVPHENEVGLGTADADFDRALREFAAGRDKFLEDIRVTAGQVAQPTKPRLLPKAQRILASDDRGDRTTANGVRNRLSAMKSLSRTSTLRRPSYARTSKRLSGYNSVIPTPQRFLPDPNMHPLRRPYEPVLLDSYPSKNMPDETKQRAPFPDYVPMFVFPNDVNVLSADAKPRCTWHGFAMTGADNARLYGMCLIMWIPLNHDASEELERQCAEWRKNNMSDEERELASSLGERLASERAKLSELLARLPQMTSGSSEREAHEDDISAVEERIGLMTDMLRPVRHGAASRIDGLTDSESGFWIPRAYGILGRDAGLTSFWKEWLRAVVVPMMNGAVLRVPSSSPKVGLWQPLERYVINLCAEAPSPMSSITQVEVAVRELRMYARKEAVNEIPGCRNTDLYALFRCLDIPDIVVLFEYVLAESRVILLSSHTSMLHLASAAIVQLMYPLKWAGIFIPVLPARLIQALEAPCPYIVGIERRYHSVELPGDDYVLVDLDQGVIEATSPPMPMPRQQRRKLVSILQLAAPHHYRFGVPLGTPSYATDAYPNDAFVTETPSIFRPNASPSNLSYFANLNSSAFGGQTERHSSRQPLLNVFYQSRQASPIVLDRPNTGSTNKTNAPLPPVNSSFSTSAPPLGMSVVPKHDTSNALQASLKDKRSGMLDGSRKRHSSFGLDRISPLHRPSLPFVGHTSSMSVSTISGDSHSTYNYAPSTYAQSSLAASTIMPTTLMQPVRNTETTQWVEGHCMQWRATEAKESCSVCDEKADDGIYRCNSCGTTAHNRCLQQICIVCSNAFHPDQVMAAFIRCFASLFYTYRKFLGPVTGEQRKVGMLYQFNFENFVRSVPSENAAYLTLLRDTQAFNEFIYERETKRPDDPAVRLFDEIILSKRNRGRTSFFSKSSTAFLSDTSDHLWRSAAATVPSSRTTGAYQHVMGRSPAKLDPTLMKEPQVVQGLVNMKLTQNKSKRKPVPSMLGPGIRASKSEGQV